MEFSSLTFVILFMPTVIVLNGLLKNTKINNVSLVVISFIFIGYYQLTYLLFYISLMLLTFIFGKKVSSNNKIKWCYLAIILFGLCFFKYNGAISLNFDISLINVVMPLGFSFYTFTSIGYIFDISQGKIEAEQDIIDFLVFNSLFAVFISGPILKYNDVRENIKYRTITCDSLCKGLRKFIIGLGKKTIVANNLAIIVDYTFNFDGIYNWQISLLAGISFTLQIYYDFSGYSDMAIGLCNMLGFNNIKENFNYPYISNSISEFWRRWHISLGRFFKDYVYIPLGGNRVTNTRMILNLFIVWLLTGIWHGNTIVFVIWGMFHFIIIIFEKFIKLPKYIGYIYVIPLTIIGWIIFNSSDVNQMYIILRGLLNFNVFYNSQFFLYSGILYLIPLVLISIIGSTPIVIKILNKININIYDIYLIFILGLSVMMIINNSFESSIYFQF